MKNKEWTISPQVLASLHMERKEKILAGAHSLSGLDVFASKWGLYLVRVKDENGGVEATGEPGPGKQPGIFRRLWTDIGRVSLRDGNLTLTWTTGEAPTIIELDNQAGRLAAVINEYVTSSVVTSSELSTPGGQIRVTIRRDACGGMFSQIVLEGAASLDNPDVENLVALTERGLRESVGLPE